MAPVLVSGGERLLDQEAPEAAAVDEQVRVQSPAVRKADRLDEAVGIPKTDADDLAFDTLHAARFGEATQEAGVKGRVEMIGVPQAGQHRPGIAAGGREASQACGDGRKAIVLNGGRVAALRLSQPVLVELHPLHIHPDLAERMHVAIALSAPIDEFDAELERALGRLDEARFVDAEHGVEGDKGRNGGFPDADRSDLLGLDQTNTYPGRQTRHCGCGHPSRRAAADDQNLTYCVRMERRGGEQCHGRLSVLGRSGRVDYIDDTEGSC